MVKWEIGNVVAAICGATLTLTAIGVLNHYKHTSNFLDYLIFCSKKYCGEELYPQANSYTERNLITANSAGGLAWEIDILESLKVYPPKMLDTWYNYYVPGDAKYYHALMSEA